MKTNVALFLSLFSRVRVRVRARVRVRVGVRVRVRVRGREGLRVGEECRCRGSPRHWKRKEEGK